MASFLRTLPLIAALLAILALFVTQSAHAVDSGAAAAAALLKPSAPASAATPSTAAVAAVETGKSGLPLPRFVSLKASKVNVRVGPGEKYAIAWTFTRAALPVEVIQEFETWRRVRDSDGSVGWVLHSLLSSKRTVVVAPWALGEPKALYATPAEVAAVTAYVEAGIQADVGSCQRSWCRISGRGFAGWIEQAQLWGVYPGEDVP
jgi:SH3-like domain-containing protein